MTKKAFFEELLEIEISFHDRNLRTLAIEMYEIHHDISLIIMNETFNLRDQNQYDLRNGHILMFQKLELLIKVLRVLDISVPRFGKLY